MAKEDLSQALLIPPARNSVAKSNPKEQSPFRVQWAVRYPERNEKAAQRPSVEAECHAGRGALKGEVARDYLATRESFGGQEHKCRMERIPGRQQTADCGGHAAPRVATTDFQVCTGPACADRSRTESIWIGT